MSLIEATRRCLANSAFTINLACMLIVFVGIGASEFILPFYFRTPGFGSDISGLLFLALPMVNAFIGPLSGTVSDRVGCGPHGGRSGLVRVRSLCGKHARRALFYPLCRVLRRVYVVQYVDFPESQ